MLIIRFMNVDKTFAHHYASEAHAQMTHSLKIPLLFF